MFEPYSILDINSKSDLFTVQGLVRNGEFRRGLDSFISKKKVSFSSGELLFDLHERSSLLGNAYMFTLSCYLGFNNTNVQKHILTNIDKCIEVLTKEKLERPKQFRELIYEKLNECKVDFEDIFHFKKIKTKQYDSIINVARILPGFNLRLLGKDASRQEREEIRFHLEKLIANTPSEIICAKSNVHINPHLSYSQINGRPDFLLDNSILEVKATKTYFSSEHFYQAFVYYLIDRLGDSNNELPISKHDVTRENKSISLFYPYYKSVISFDPLEVYGKEQIERVTAWFKNTIDLLVENKFRIDV